MFAYTKQMENSDESREEKKRIMDERRTRLKSLIDKENKSHEEELKQLRKSGGLNPNLNTIEELKMRSEQLKSAREDERRKLAQEKLYENWRQNNPELRQIESRQLQSHVVNAWGDQIKHKVEASEQMRQEENEYLQYLELERQKAEDLDLELKRLKLNREIELKELLKQQMIELKQREAESEVLKREEAQLMHERLNINSLNEQRHAIMDKNSRQDYGRQLLRQHKAKLRQRAKEVQQELEFDLKILQSLKDANEEQRHMESAKRLKARADAEQMIQVLNQQLRLEKEREAELEAMFQDEAQKEWDKKNEIWKRESMAREALMRQVLEERQQQLEEKYSLLAEKKLESLHKREELVKDMERTQLLMIKEREKLEAAKLERKRELEQQMTARKDQFLDENLVEDVNNYEQEQIKDESYKNFLENEKNKKLEAKFEPKVNLKF